MQSLAEDLRQNQELPRMPQDSSGVYEEDYLIDHYKETKDWNSKQTGGNLQKSVFYDESD